MTYNQALAILARVNTKELSNLFEDEFGAACVIDSMCPDVVQPGYVSKCGLVSLVDEAGVIEMAEFMDAYLTASHVSLETD
jgi:hypothetical protein